MRRFIVQDISGLLLLLSFLIIFQPSVAAPMDDPGEAGTCAAYSPSLEMGIDDAVTAYREGRLEEALRIYRYLSEGSDDPEIAGISSFMSGYIMGKLMIDGGDEYLRRSYERYPLLRDYTLFRLAEIYEKMEEYEKAADLFERVYESYREGVLAKKSLMKAADSYLAAGRLEEAKGAYNTFITIYQEDRSIPSALYGMGRCYLLEGDYLRAFDLFKRVWVDYPSHPLSSKAKEDIERLKGEGYEIPPLTPADIYRRGENLYRAGLYSDALAEYLRFLSRREGIDDSMGKEALFKTGMAYYYLRKSEKAEEAWESFLNHYPTHPLAPEALYWLGRTYLRQGKEDAFVRAYRRYLERYRKSGKGPEVLYRLGSFYAEKGKVETAMSYFDRAIREFPESSYASESRWAKGWLLYKEKMFREALRVFDDILQRKGESIDVPRVLYWKARVLERMNDPIGMETQLCRLCSQYEGSFYCLFAKHSYDIPCISSIDDASAHGVEIAGPGDYGAEIIRDGVAIDNRIDRVRLFYSLGLKEEAVDEIQWEQKRMQQNDTRAIRLASILNELGEYNQALRVLYSGLSRDFLQRGRFIDKEISRLMYPEGYSGLIMRYACEYGLDPDLIYALIREESWFNEHALSTAGAVGLMQLMPYTAVSILNDPDLKRETLFEPERNISLGTRFFSDMVRRFEGNMILAVASYNAGPVVVERWIREREGFEMDEFIEDIPYRETREYVKKVFKSYMEYRRMAESSPITSSSARYCAVDTTTPKVYSRGHKSRGIE